METAQSEHLAAIVDRLVAEYPDRQRHELERIVAESWALFAGSDSEASVRVVATEWYARTQL